MESKLSAAGCTAGGKSAVFYRDAIAEFSDADYRQKRSDKLAALVLRKLRGDEGDDTVSDKGQQKKSKSGKVFEYLIAEMLVMHGLVPFYSQVSMWKVPMSKMDFLLYDEDAPVVFTCKLSLAERWRQAAFEGIFLQNVYRHGKCYVVSADEDDVVGRNKDINNGDIKGITKCFMADSAELKDLLTELAKRKFRAAHHVDPIRKGKLIGANL